MEVQLQANQDGADDVERGAVAPMVTRRIPGERDRTQPSPDTGNKVNGRVQTPRTRGRQSQPVCARSTNGNGRNGQLPVQPVQFVQINLQHAKGATAVLQKTLSTGKGLSVALIQEPWAHGETIRGLKSQDRTLFSVRGQGRPRAAVACSKELKPVLLPQLSTRDLAVVQINASLKGVGRKNIIVASAYLPGDEAIPQMQLDQLFDFCRINKSELLIGMDANAHNTIWGSSDTNTRGEEVLNLMFTWGS